MSILVPTPFDAAITFALLALTVAALVSVGRCRALSAGQALVWVLVVLFVPALGPVAWLVAGRRVGPGATV